MMTMNTPSSCEVSTGLSPADIVAASTQPDAAIILVLDRRGHIAYVDASANSLLAFRTGELLGSPLRRLLPELHRTTSTTAWLRECCQQSGERKVTVVARDGRQTLYSARCTVFSFGPEKGYVLSLRAALPRKGTEKQLNASEEFLRRIVDTAGDAIISVNAHNTITLFNPMAESVFGYRAKEVLGKPLDVLLPVRSRGRHAKMMAKFGAQGSATRMMGQRGEITGLRRDGTEFPAEASISHFEIANSPVYTVVLRDVSELRQAERERRRSARLFQAIFNQTFQFLGILRADGTIIELNDTTLKLWGSSREDVIGRPFCDFGWRDSTAEDLATISACLTRAQTGEFVRVEVPFSGPGRATRIIDFSLKPIFDEADGIAMLIFEGRDITERIHAEAALRLSESRLSNAQRIAKLGNWGWDVLTGDLYWSDEVFAIFGQERSSFGATYELFLKSVHPDDREMVEREVRRALEDKLPYSIDHRILLPSGEVRIVHEQGEVLYDDAGHAIRMTGIVQDITGQKEIEHRLRAAKLEAEAASQAKTVFLANMSHELRTPLNAVIGFAEVMERELFGPVQPAKYRAYIKEIFESGQHLLGLINNILDMSKIEAGQMTLAEQKIDLAMLLQSCARSFGRRTQEARLTLTTDWEASLPPVLADTLIIRQILLNLLSNAIKFTPSGGSISLSAYRDRDGHVVIRVKDTGIGMAEADIPKAFEIFGQVDNSITRKYEGTGLGLPLTASLVQLHQGQLLIESAPGKGTTVFVQLPSSRVLP